jgi:UDP-glucose 4-epimerase
MNKKVVVFGGAGFLGNYVVSELLNRGYTVFAADLKRPEYNQEVDFIECDIMDTEDVKNALSSDVDYVYNLAGFSQLEKAHLEPKLTVNLNVIGNINILNACVKNKIKRIVYASSAYAVSEKGSFYGISKLSSEKIIEEYQNHFDLDYTILRYGSVYCERDVSNNYIFNLIKTAIETGEINHCGDGEEIREYIHAADAARLSVDVIEDDKFSNQHIILTGMEKMKRVELFNMIQEILGENLNVKLKKDGYNNHYRFTPYSFQASMSKKLVSNPFIDIGQGILECINEIKNQK